MDELQRTLRDYQERANILESNKKKDENGLPVNLLDQIKLQRELSDYFREKIDVTFGEGTSQTAFGETRNLDVCKQFFNGILPFFQTARAEKIAQYTSVTSAKKTKHKK